METLIKLKTPQPMVAELCLHERVAEGDEHPVVIPLVVDIVQVEIPVRVIVVEVRRVEVTRLRITPEHLLVCDAPSSTLPFPFDKRRVGAVFYARLISQSASRQVPHVGKRAAIRYRKAMPYRYSDLPTSPRFPSP